MWKAVVCSDATWRYTGHACTDTGILQRQGPTCPNALPSLKTFELCLFANLHESIVWVYLRRALHNISSR